VRHVAQAEGDADQVEAGGGKGQPLGVAGHRGQHQALVEQAVAATRSMASLMSVCTTVPLRADRREGAGQVAGAAGDVEHLVAGAQVGHRHRVGLPARCRPNDIRSFITS
jgi:hypothetical protein